MVLQNVHQLTRIQWLEIVVIISLASKVISEDLSCKVNVFCDADNAGTATGSLTGNEK